MNAPVNETQLKRTGKIRIDFTARNLKPRIDAIKTIIILKSKGYKIGLISDCTAETPLAWPKTDLAQLFDVTVFSCLARIKKPGPISI